MKVLEMEKTLLITLYAFKGNFLVCSLFCFLDKKQKVDFDVFRILETSNFPCKL